MKKVIMWRELKVPQNQPWGWAENYTLGTKMQQLPESKNAFGKPLASISEKMKGGIININQD